MKYNFRKRLIALLPGMMCMFLLSAQSNIRLNNYWENTHYINPASTNEEYIGEVSMAARQQMLGYGDGAPSTFWGSATLYNEQKQMQWGINFTQDKIGYSSTHDFGLSYAYSIYFQRYWHLHLGLALRYQDVSYDLAGIKLTNYTDQSLYKYLVAEKKANADVGAELVNTNWKIGAAGTNLLSPVDYKMYGNTNIFYTMYHNIDRQATTDWGAGMCLIQTRSLVQAELNTMLYFKTESQKEYLKLGLTYRTRADFGFLFGINISDNLHMSYLFDYDLSGISQSSYGSHELMLVYRFTKQKNCHCEAYNE